MLLIATSRGFSVEFWCNCHYVISRKLAIISDTHTHTQHEESARNLTIGFSSRVLSRVCRHGTTLSFCDSGLPLSIRIRNSRAGSTVTLPRPFDVLTPVKREREPPRINLKSIANTTPERARERETKSKAEARIEIERKRIMAGGFPT